MDQNKFIIVFYKERNYVFGICPCCKEIIPLKNCNIFYDGKEPVLKELQLINRIDQKVKAVETKLEKLESKKSEIEEEIEIEEIDYDQNVVPLIEKRYKKQGRKKALHLIDSIDRVFNKRSIDPRDVRVVFNPVEFVIFDGMTDKKKSVEITFLGKKPENKKNEKIFKSLEKTIQNGNYKFNLIHVDEKGKITFKQLS